DANAVIPQRLAGPLEGAQLRVAVRAPGTPVEQHDGEVAGERVRDRERLAAGGLDCQPRERVAGVEQGHRGSPSRLPGRSRTGPPRYVGVASAPVLTGGSQSAS